MMSNKNHTKSIGIFVFLFCFQSIIFAQQTPTFGEYGYNTFILNSAYAGFGENTEVNLSNSGFMNKFEGNPRNFTLSLNTPLNDGKVGLGGGFIQDDIGVTSYTHLFAAYSYKIFFDLKSNRPHWQHYNPTVLSFGLTGGAMLFRDDLLELGITNDPNFQENINATIPTIGFGFMFNHDSFFIGFSSPNILGDSLASEDNLDIQNAYYGYAGYRFFTNIFEETIIKPNVLIKQEKGSAVQADFNVAVSFNNKFEV